MRETGQPRRRSSKSREAPRREVVDDPSLEIFKVKLKGALSNLIKLKMPLLMAGGLD